MLSVQLRAADLASLLSGKVIPLSMSLTEFDDNWRRVTIHGGSNVGGNISLNVSGNTSNSVAQNNNVIGMAGGGRTFITKGQVIPGGSAQLFLVAYHLPAHGLDLGTLLQAAATKSAPKDGTLTKETVLRLCLLELKSITSLEDIRVFDMNQEIEFSAQAAKALENMFKQQEQGGKPVKQAASAESEK